MRVQISSPLQAIVVQAQSLVLLGSESWGWGTGENWGGPGGLQGDGQVLGREEAEDGGGEQILGRGSRGSARTR